MPIAAHAEEAVTRLLAEGTLSQREIARRAGVSRGSVQAIVSGARPARLSRRLAARGEPQVDRCRGCGRLVQVPCRACQLRTIFRRARRFPEREFVSGADDKMTIDLRGMDRVRYLGIKEEYDRLAEPEVAHNPLPNIVGRHVPDELPGPSDEDLEYIEGKEAPSGP